MAEYIYKYLQPKRDTGELIMNKTIKGKQDILSIDSFPRELSNNISEFIYDARSIKDN